MIEFRQSWRSYKLRQVAGACYVPAQQGWVH